MNRPLRIDIYSDTVCPWCYLGKRRLAAALDARPQYAPKVIWRPFELNADLPPEGVAREEFFARRGLSPSALEEGRRTLVDLGRSVGIAFRFDLQTRVPNTRRSHLLVALGARCGKQAEVLEQLMHAYFEEGRDIGDVDELVRIGAQAGLDGREVGRVLVLRTGQDALIAAERHAAALGLTGVPTFVFNGEFALSGAQDPESLVAALDRVVASPGTQAGRA
ncbi:MAG: DsbA family oxidoreductase [Steroidobacteraceae bacterium]|nr:DsbA family oxidoreductase [Steroidobacteraceae bacterium]